MGRKSASAGNANHAKKIALYERNHSRPWRPEECIRLDAMLITYHADENGKIVRVFLPGGVTMEIAEFVDFAVERGLAVRLPKPSHVRKARG